MKISFCVGRSAPPDSTSATVGSPFSSRDLRGAEDLLDRPGVRPAPPFTVGSLAVIMHSTPSTTPMPVTTLAPTVQSQARPAREQPGEHVVLVDEQLDPLAGEQLAQGVVAVDVLRPAARDGLGVLGVERRAASPASPSGSSSRSPAATPRSPGVAAPPLAEALGLRVDPRSMRRPSPWPRGGPGHHVDRARGWAGGRRSTSREDQRPDKRADPQRVAELRQPGDPRGVERRVAGVPPRGPRLASPPLSPDRACTNVPSGSCRVRTSWGAGYGEGRRPSSGTSSTSSGGSGTGSRRPSACTTVWVTAVRSTYAGR